MPTTTPPRRILVIKSRNIGDVLLTGPLLSALKRHWPEASITALVKAGTEAMLAHHPHVSEVLVFPQRERNESGFAWAGRQMRFLSGLRKERFDLAINTTEGDRGAITAFLSGARQRIGLGKHENDKAWRRRLYSRVVLPPLGLRHTVIRNLDLLPRGVAGYHHVHLGFTGAHMARVKTLLDRAGWREGEALVQVHPTSRWFFKCWQDRNMARVIDHLQRERGLRVVVTAAPDDRERGRLDAILALCETRPIDLGGQLSLEETAALASLCRLFFGVDTAPMHMAAALDVPVVALFGPSGAFDWGPWPNGWDGAGTPYPRRNGIQRAGQHIVVQKDWDCAPCGRDGCEGGKRSRCLDELTAEEVLPLIDEALTP
jgi:heptosyltransferase-3